MPKPELSTIPAFYHNYVNRVEEENTIEALQKSHTQTYSLLQAIPTEKWHYRYADGKWSILEMVQHMIDAERIFAYRALCIARGDKGSLPGFDENAYAENSGADNRSATELLEEWTVVRQSTILLFKSFNQEQTARTGIANSQPISVNAIGFIAAGHALHHLHILQERYL
ncbi:MAG TPA: DinB family protein [Flavisolibacter sp.]|jgi:exoribonuclease II|nr:DinB family protein [Flavisolibacter sp.]